MHIDWHLHELNLKIVYYGPALSGKTTNLEQIYARIDPRRRSELISLKTHDDRTLFFDFLQLELGRINNLTPKVHLYTVPGQSYYEASRRVVLRGADGVVFVADSSPERAAANLESWRDMEHQLGAVGAFPEDLPVVIQCNKQDIGCAMPASEIKFLLNVNGLTAIPAIAARGEGILDTLKAILSRVVASIQKQAELSR